MSDNIKSSFDNLPEWGLREISSVDIAEVGDFLNLPKSGFFICRQGTITVGFSNRFYTLVPGDMIIYPIKTILFIKEYSADVQGTVGIADMGKVLEISSRVVNSSNRISILVNPYISLTSKEMEGLEEMISIILKRQDEGEANPLTLEALLNALCYEIAGIYKKKCNDSRPVSDRGETVILAFLFSLKDNVRQNRQVKFYAKEQCLSVRYFSRLIKDKTGYGPLEIITKATMKEAVELLADPSLTIKEISYMLNFPSPSFFGRWFKHYQGVTPASYRAERIR